MKPYAMTESDRGLVAMALRAKAAGDGKLALDLGHEPSLQEQFQRQAKQAVDLAEKIEQSDLVNVWPYDANE